MYGGILQTGGMFSSFVHRWQARLELDLPARDRLLARLDRLTAAALASSPRTSRGGTAGHRVSPDVPPVPPDAEQEDPAETRLASMLATLSHSGASARERLAEHATTVSA